MSKIADMADVLERAGGRKLVEFARLGAPPISRGLWREVHDRLPSFYDEEAEHLARAVADLNDEYARVV